MILRELLQMLLVIKLTATCLVIKLTAKFNPLYTSFLPAQLYRTSFHFPPHQLFLNLIQHHNNMPQELTSPRPLFGAAISTAFPPRFQDVSNIRQIPDHQEVFVDPTRDESLIFELLDLKTDVADEGSAVWFLRDLANEQEAEGANLIEQSGVFTAEGLKFRNSPAVVTTAVGQMGISKGRQGREANNIVKVYVANLRLKEVGTDVLITAYEPLLINHLSESVSAVGAGLVVPATQSGCMPMAEIFKVAVSSFKVHDWTLFGPSA